MRKIVVFVIALSLPAATAAAAATTEDARSSTTPSATASVVRVDQVRAPERRVIRRRFRPWARPSPRAVREIIRAEARRWRIPAAGLARRIACESGYRWWASSGTYHGLLQFHPTTFYRGLSTLRDRRVRLVRSAVRRVNDRRIVHYSDGTKRSRRSTPRRQRLYVVYRGFLPRRPALTHAWAQVRIGAQAIRGVSAVRSSEWGCSA